jgi:hypothetical protein
VDPCTHACRGVTGHLLGNGSRMWLCAMLCPRCLAELHRLQTTVILGRALHAVQCALYVLTWGRVSWTQQNNILRMAAHEAFMALPGACWLMCTTRLYRTALHMFCRASMPTCHVRNGWTRGVCPGLAHATLTHWWGGDQGTAVLSEGRAVTLALSGSMTTRNTCLMGRVLAGMLAVVHRVVQQCMWQVPGHVWCG